MDFSDVNVNSSESPYELTLEDREHYLYACVQAEFIDVAVALLYINDLIARLREMHHSKVLLVRDTPHKVTKGDYYMTSGALATLLPKDKKVAIVDRSPSHEIVKQVIKEHSSRRPSIDAFDSFEEAEA